MPIAASSGASGACGNAIASGVAGACDHTGSSVTFKSVFVPGFSLAFIGIGLYRLWYQFNFYNLHFSADMGMVTVGANMARVLAIGILACILIRKGFDKTSRSTLVWSGFVLMTLSSVLYLFDLFFNTADFEALRMVIGGVGLVGGEVMWLLFLERVSPGRCFLYIAGGLALSCILSLIMGYLNAAVAGMVNLFVPALSVFAYWRSMRLADEGAAGWQAQGCGTAGACRPAAKGKAAWKCGAEIFPLVQITGACLLYALLLGMALGYPDGRLRELSQGVRSVHQVLVVLIVFMAVWWVLIRGRGFDFSAYWLFQNVLMMVSVCMLMSEWPGAHEASTFFATNAMTCFYLPLIYFICLIARRLEEPASLAYAVIYGGSLLCMALGRVLVHEVGPLMVMESGHNLMLLVTMALLVLLELTLGLAAIRSMGAYPLGWELGRKTACRSVVGGAVAAYDDGHAVALGCGEERTLLENPELPVETGSAGDALSAGEDGGCAGDSGEAASSDCSEVARDAIGALAAACDLTETEIAMVRLVAQGRSRAYIASTLNYSENTIRNYMRTLYRKVGVHTKQELLDKIDDLARAV